MPDAVGLAALDAFAAGFGLTTGDAAATPSGGTRPSTAHAATVTVGPDVERETSSTTGRAPADSAPRSASKRTEDNSLQAADAGTGSSQSAGISGATGTTATTVRAHEGVTGALLDRMA